MNKKGINYSVYNYDIHVYNIINPLILHDFVILL